jgi:hypothetical protein
LSVAGASAHIHRNEASRVQFSHVADTIGNGVPSPARANPVSNGAHHDERPNHAPRNPLLARITGLTSIAAVAATGMIVVGILAVVGGSYDKQVVHNQLVPQKIFFPATGSPALLPGVNSTRASSS